MQILGLFGMYFDVGIVFVKSFSFLFKFALVILCHLKPPHKGSFKNYVCKTSQVGSRYVVQKCPLFVNVHTIENVNLEG